MPRSIGIRSYSSARGSWEHFDTADRVARQLRVRRRTRDDVLDELTDVIVTAAAAMCASSSGAKLDTLPYECDDFVDFRRSGEGHLSVDQARFPLQLRKQMPFPQQPLCPLIAQ